MSGSEPFIEAIVGGLRVLTYWETYVAGVEYLLLYLIPMGLVGLLMSSERLVAGVGCLSFFILPLFQAAATLVFVITLSPIMLGIGPDALWAFPFQIIGTAPWPFLKFTGAIVVVSVVAALIPFLGRMHSAHTSIVAAVALAMFIVMIDQVSPKTFPPLDFVPGFWFVVGLLVVGAVASFIGQLVAAGIGGMLSEGAGGMLVIPTSAIFGFIPLFMYGAWLGAQIKGG